MVKLRNFNLVLGSDVLSKAFTALALLAMIRFLSPAEFASFIFASAAATAAYTAFNNFFNRQLIFDHAFVFHARVMQFVAVGLVAAAYAVIAGVGSIDGLNLLAAGFAFAVAAMVYDFRRSCLQRVERFKAFSTIEMARGLVLAVSTFAILWLFDEDRAALILAAQAAGFLAMAALIRLPDPGPRQAGIETAAQACRKLVSRNNLYLLGFFLLLGIMGQLAPLLYKPIATTLEYASFGSAFRYYGILVSIVTAVNTVTMPAIAKIDEDGVKALIDKMILICAASMVLVFAAIVASFLVIPFVDGGKYPSAPVEFAILAIGVIVGVILGPIISFYLRSGHVRPLFVTMAVAVAISAAIIILLAPYSKFAASAAIPAGIVVQFLLLAWPLRSLQGFKLPMAAAATQPRSGEWVDIVRSNITQLDAGSLGQVSASEASITYFSCYPLPVSQRERLETLHCGSRFMTLSALRVLPPREIWSTVRRVSTNEVCVVTADSNEQVIAPLLLTLAALSRATKITTLSLDQGGRRTVSRPVALLSIWSAIRATVAGQVLRAWYSIRSALLLRTVPLRFGPIVGGKALYLKTNLMFGTHAGGSVGHIAGVVNELLRRDPGILVQALEFPVTVSPEVRFEAQESLKTYGFPPESNQLRFNRSTIRSGRRALERERFDFIYQRMTLANLAGVVLSRKFGIPLVLEYNGSEVWVSRNWGLPLSWERTAEQIEKVCFRHATYVVTVSEPLRLDLIERGVPADRIVTYPNCIDPAKFDPASYLEQRAALRRKWLGEKDAAVALFMGTFGAWHGAEVLAEAANIWRRKHGAKRPVKFVFVGDGLQAAEVKEMLAGAKDDGDAIFTGLVSQDEAAGYLAAADIFLSPHVVPADGSRFFGSPTKLFEYMAMGRPIVASRLEQIEEVLSPDPQDGQELAILVEPGSPDDIVAALEALLEDPARGAAMATAARSRALSLYTWEEHVDRIVRMLQGPQ